jgi:hypothetical protein
LARTRSVTEAAATAEAVVVAVAGVEEVEVADAAAAEAAAADAKHPTTEKNRSMVIISECSMICSNILKLFNRPSCCDLIFLNSTFFCVLVCCSNENKHTHGVPFTTQRMRKNISNGNNNCTLTIYAPATLFRVQYNCPFHFYSIFPSHSHVFPHKRTAEIIWFGDVGGGGAAVHGYNAAATKNSRNPLV